MLPILTSFVMQDDGSGGGAAIGSILYLLIAVAWIAGMWKVFTKAGKPGWAAIIPIYNFIVLLQIAGKPLWWVFVILIVPIVNLVFYVLASIEVAKAFGKGTGYGIGLALLPFNFYPMLGFSDAAYVGTPA